MKRLWILMMALMVVLVLGACASSGPQAGDTSTEPGAVPVPAEASATTETNTTDTGSGSMGTGMASGTTEAVGSASAQQGGPGGPCSNVRCADCPEGQTPALHPPDCCKCVPLGGNDMTKDCSNVRCAACPAGQHPALVPPDCCRCIPD
ncbi:MAG TPA: hypothetical protein VN493_04460 [Thermoanaerobaculia bacterium]|nr:hypothetical protein [Thermoanaerobaculia bacterium]